MKNTQTQFLYIISFETLLQTVRSTRNDHFLILFSVFFSSFVIFWIIFSAYLEGLSSQRLLNCPIQDLISVNELRISSSVVPDSRRLNRFRFSFSFILKTYFFGAENSAKQSFALFQKSTSKTSLIVFNFCVILVLNLPRFISGALAIVSTSFLIESCSLMSGLTMLLSSSSNAGQQYFASKVWQFGSPHLTVIQSGVALVTFFSPPKRYEEKSYPMFFSLIPRQMSRLVPGLKKRPLTSGELGLVASNQWLKNSLSS